MEKRRLSFRAVLPVKSIFCFRTLPCREWTASDSSNRFEQERPTTRALLISGRISSEIIAGNALFDFLHKPFVPEQLKAKLVQILRRTPDGVEEI